MKKEISKRRREALDVFEEGIKAFTAKDLDQARTQFDLIMMKYRYEIDIVERTRLYLKQIETIKANVQPDDRELTAEESFRLGVHYFNVGDPARAWDCYQKCVELEPNHVEALYNLSCLAARLDADLTNAEQYLLKAVALAPNLRQPAIEDRDLILVVQRLGWIIDQPDKETSNL